MSVRRAIAVGGENLIDFIQTGQGEDGTPVYASNPGGSPFNVAVALGRQDAPVHYITPISSDDMGDSLAERLRSAGVSISHPRVPQPTSRAVVTLADGIPSYTFHRVGTAERMIDVATMTQLVGEDVAALHIGSLALTGGADADAWEEIATQAAKRGVFISLDPNVRPLLVEDREEYTGRITRLLKCVHLVKLSDEDLSWLFPGLKEMAAFDALLRLTNAPLVVLTRGPEGAIGQAGTIRVKIPAPKVDPLVDTVGAGDTFHATLLATLGSMGHLHPEGPQSLTAESLRVLLTRAATAAALNCQRSGCNPPNRSEINAAVEAAINT